MSSYFDEASLVMIPSGYKNQKVYSVKPLDGSGDLTFSRASSATRVASNGLIEKVRTNLILQSNTFSNASWGNIGSSETSGQAGYDGTNNAWSLVEDSSTGVHTIVQVPSTFGLVTLSVYAKAGTRNWVFLRGVQSSSNVRAWFNLSTGAIGTVEANGTAKIESVGNGWYRCSLSVANFESGFEAYVGISSADNTPTYTGNGTGNILIQNFQYEQGDIATDYIATTSAAVSVGPVSGLPRLDYLNSTCPRLLLEPQRTNISLYSEQFDNAAWTKQSATITANATTSPDGTVNADKFIATAVNDGHIVRQFPSLADNTNYALSVFAKSAGYNFLQLQPTTKNDVSSSTYFNLSTGQLGTVGAGHTASIEAYGNGWYKCTIVYNSGSGAGNTFQRIRVAQSNNQDAYTGNGTDGIFIWGAQLEAGAYATSYIPTLGTSVTRVADAASKTSASALIGQTEGTLYWEGSITGVPVDQSIFGVEKESSNFVIRFGGNGTNIYAQSYNGSTSLFFETTTPSVGQTIKLAFAYKAGSYAFYKNGTLVASGSNASTIPACDKIQTNVLWSTGSGVGAYNTSQALIFKTRLSNSDLATLTTL